MKNLMRLILALTALAVFSSNSFAAILIYSSNGALVANAGVTTLAQAATSTACAGKKIVFTTDQTLTANLVWPADRELVPENFAKINHGAYTISYAGSTVRWPLAQIFNGTGAVTGLTSPRAEWFGFSASASGADNQVALTKFATSMVSGANAKLPVGTFAVAGLWTIATPCKIDMTGCTLNFSDNSPNQGIRITSNNVRLVGGIVQGPQFAATEATQIGVYAFGANSGNYLSGVELQGTKVNGWAGSGIRFLFVENFKMDSPDVSDCYAEGIGGMSVRYGVIVTPKVDNVVAPIAVTGGTYGIILTKNIGDISAYPVSHDVKIIHPVVSNIPTWEAIDTHAGYNITIDNPVVTDCGIGITIAKYSSGGLNISPHDITIINPIIKNETLAQTDVMSGIVISADETSSAAFGRNISVIGGTIENMGDSNAVFGSFGAAVYAYGIHNLKIKGMTLVNSGTHAFALDYIGENLDVSDNTIKGLVNPVAAAFYAQPRSGALGAGGTISRNIIDVVGTAFYSYGSTTIDLIENKIVAATTHYDQNGGTYALQYWGRVDPVHIATIAWDPPSIASTGNAVSTTTDLPGVSSVVTARVGGMNRDLLGMTLNALTAATDTNKGTLALTLYNYTGAPRDLASTNFKVRFSKDQ